MTAMNDYSPRYVGDLSHPLVHTFVDGFGKAHDLSNVVIPNIKMRMKLQGINEVARDGTGVWATFGDPAQGMAQYQWDALDVATVGMWWFQASVPFPDGFLHFQICAIEFILPL